MSELTIVLKVEIEPQPDALGDDHVLPWGTATAEVVCPVREADEPGVTSEYSESMEDPLDRTAVIVVRVQR